MMLRFAVIGTSWITERFIDAAHLSGKMKLAGVYSREMERAKAFADKFSSFQPECFDDLAEMAKADLDVVYIASPNSYHAPQAALFLLHQKHVICEKPLASNDKEVSELIALAKQNQAVLFEGLKSVYTPNFQQIKNHLPKLGQLRKVVLNNCQYSSRYPLYLEGKNTNTFNPQFSNGSLMDIGVYPLSIAVELFGEPDDFFATGVLLDSGVDGHGTLILKYDLFDVVITHSKVGKGILPSEIVGEEGSLLLTEVSESGDVHFYQHGKQVADLSVVTQHENNLLYEVEAFVELVETQNIDHAGLQRSLLVSRLSTMARERIGVKFPADEA